MRRYSDRPLPPYRYLPDGTGRTPHPRRHPEGHSFGAPEETPAFDPERWAESAEYRYGVDLYNAGYFWECHEVFESLWNAVGRESDAGRLLQALIQVAAARLKRELGQERPARTLAEKALRSLERFDGAVLGIDVPGFAGAVRAFFRDDGAAAPGVRLSC